ncbi:hypothetical protein BR93DRAFT_479492 [Coniochaeta sp. PMI_546]|nr:hypothetical protein BR93DRAFT_479492 [Coniochaeta sp. PMI_546]
MKCVNCSIASADAGVNRKELLQDSYSSSWLEYSSNCGDPTIVLTSHKSYAGDQHGRGDHQPSVSLRGADGRAVEGLTVSCQGKKRLGATLRLRVTPPKSRMTWVQSPTDDMYACTASEGERLREPGCRVMERLGPRPSLVTSYSFHKQPWATSGIGSLDVSRVVFVPAYLLGVYFSEDPNEHPGLSDRICQARETAAPLPRFEVTAL